MIWGENVKGKICALCPKTTKKVGISTKPRIKPRPVRYCRTFSEEQRKNAQMMKTIMKANQELVSDLIMTKELVDNPV